MSYNESNSENLVKCEERWIYGIKTDDTQRPFISVGDDLLYLVSSRTVVYSPMLNRQKIYAEHSKEILSMVYSPQKNIVITGEAGN